MGSQGSPAHAHYSYVESFAGSLDYQEDNRIFQDASQSGQPAW
jgi:hypothetical protein